MKVFEFDARKGTLIANTGQLLSLSSSNTKFVNTDKGSSVFSSTSLTGLNVPALNVTSNYYTIRCCVKTNKLNGARFFIHGTEFTSNGLLLFITPNVNNGLGIQFLSDDGTILINTSSFTNSPIFKKSVWYDITLTFNSFLHKTNLYVNGIFYGTMTWASNKSFTNLRKVLNLNYENGGSFGNIGYLNNCTIYNHIIAQKEINDNYVDFLNSKPLSKPIVFQPNLNILKPSEIRENGLIAAYNFQPVNGKLPNLAWDNQANGNNARQYDATPTNFQGTSDNMRFLSNSTTYQKYGKFTLANATPLLSKFSVTFIIKAGINQGELNAIAMTGSGANTDIRFITSNSRFQIVVNGVSQELPRTGSISYTQWSTVVLTCDGSTFKLYLNGLFIDYYTPSTPPIVRFLQIMGGGNYVGVTGGWMYFRDFKIYNRALSDQEIKNYHNQFASKEVLFEDFSQYPVGTTKFGNWQKSSSFIISEVSKQTSKYMPRGTKYMACSISSVASINYPSNTAYGTWEFLMGKSNNNTNLYFLFIAQGIQSYQINWPIGNNKITLIKGSVIASSNLNYNTGVVKVKITRSLTGLFSVKINDTDIFSASDNSLTTSTSLLLYSTSSSGGFLSNLKITQGITV